MLIIYDANRSAEFDKSTYINIYVYIDIGEDIYSLERIFNLMRYIYWYKKT